LVLALAVAAGAPQTSSAAPGWRQFKHPALGFRIAYPAGWDTLTGNGQASWIAIGPASASEQRFRMNVVVVTARTPAGATIDEAGEQLQRALDRPGETARVLRTDRTEVGETPALLTYVSRRTAQGLDLYQMLLITIHYRRGYAIVGSTASTSTKIAAETQLLQRILLTFRPD
jgi:hypothetical protein